MDKETNWHLGTNGQLPFDPLLECLVTLTKLLERPHSAQALTEGLPLVNYHITPKLFIRAAERAGLAAKLVCCPIRSISAKKLPAILILNNKEAWILTKLNSDGTAEVIQPETGEGVVTVTWEELLEKYSGYTLFVKPKYRFDSRSIKPLPSRPKQWFWNVIFRAWPIYSEVLVASCLINLFVIALPLFIMNVYDRVVPNEAFETLWVLAIGISIVIVFEYLLRLVRGYFIDAAGKKIDTKLSTTTFEQLLGIQMAARPKSVGSLANTVHAFEAFREFITSGTISLVVDLFFVFIFLTVVWILGGSLVLAPAIAIAAILIVGLSIQIPLGKLVSQSYRHASEKNAVLVETLAGVETIKGLRAESFMQRKWERIIHAAAKINVKVRMLMNIGTNTATFIQQLAIIAVVIIGVYKITGGVMSVGALIACIILARRAVAPVAQIAGLLTRYKQSKAALTSLDNIMKLPVERPQGKLFLQRSNLSGGIEFNQVSFVYPESPLNALEKISFRITPGERVAIIGSTGSGKSTIQKLILKLYQPTSGSVLIDGTELGQIDPAELRYHIGYIPQDIVLFHGNVRENIVISAPYVEDSTLLRVAKLSGVDKFIQHHPLGFDRPVGECGGQLSGGQRQAIAIARALLLDPPILVFDEPSQSIDNKTTLTLIQQLNTHAKDKTLVLVTHKTNILSLVNRIIVMDHGRIIADGPKNEIIQQLSGHEIKPKVDT